MKRFKLLIPILLLLCIGPVVAQLEECPAIVQRVLENLDDICSATDRNQACYGNLAMQALPRENVQNFQFDNVGDIEAVADIETLRLSPLDTETDAWGVALMRLQANLPDTLAGQSVTFLLFGDVELTNAVPADSTTARPMQAFYLRTGVGDAGCAEAPESGLLVRTPEGVGEISFSVNGVDVALGSTVFFQAQPGQNMTARTYEGSAAMTINDQVYPIIAGTQRRVPLGENLLPAGEPEDLTPYEEPTNSLAPFQVIRDTVRPVRPVRPLTDREIQVVNTLVRNGSPVCGAAAFLPRCEDTITSLGGDKCPLGDDGECDITPRGPIWDTINPIGYPGELPPPEVTEEPEINTQPEITPELEITPTDYPGCFPGACLPSTDPEIACKCALCGIECPADGGNSSPADGVTDEEIAEICEADPTNEICDNQEGDNDSNPGDNNGGGNTGGGNTGGGGQPAVEPTAVPVPTDVPAEPTAVPTECIPSPFDDCGTGFPPGA